MSPSAAVYAPSSTQDLGDTTSSNHSCFVAVATAQSIGIRVDRTGLFLTITENTSDKSLFIFA